MGNAASEHAEAKREELEFMKAVYEGEEEKVAKLLQSHPDVINARSKDNQNAWHFAAHQGHLKILEMFHRDAAIALRRTLDKGGKGGFSVDQQNKKGQTPLILACEGGWAGCVDFLIRVAGADPWLTDGHGYTCLHYAAVKGNTKCIEAVLSSDPELAPEGSNRLQLQLNPLPQIGRALEKVPEAFSKVPEAISKVPGAFSKIPGAFQKLQPRHRQATEKAPLAQEKDGEGSEATQEGEEEEEEAAGTANSKLVNARTKTGLTPLHCAVYHGHVEAAQMLLAFGSRLVAQTMVESLENVACNAGSTPLHLAAMRGNEKMVRMLMSAYIAILENPSAESQGIMCPDPRVVPDNYGLTPFSIATNFKHQHIIHHLDPETALDINPQRSGGGGVVSPKAGSFVRRDTVSRRSGSFTNAGTVAVKDADAETAPVASAAVPTAQAAPTPVPSEPDQNDGKANAEASTSPPASTVDSIIGKYFQGASAQPPDRFLCPISGKVFEDPVVAEDGNTYERGALQAWFKEGKQHLPGGCHITTTMMLPNNAMKADVAAWKKSQKPDGSL